MNQQNKEIKTVVVVGGGIAGWLTAGRLAAHHKSNTPDGLNVVLVESLIPLDETQRCVASKITATSSVLRTFLSSVKI